MKIRQSYLAKNPCYTANVNRVDSRYVRFQDLGPQALMLHSVGCPQPNAEVFVNRWNNASYNRACVHAFIDANTGDVWQTLPWNYRGWHCGGSGNNTHIGVEICESNYITYTHADQFTCSNYPAARKQATTAYNTAVELFAFLCKRYNLDPMLNICSHKEGWYKGIASGHRDPEHYWTGLGMDYTMDGFRADVKAKMEDEIDMTKEELNTLLNAKIGALRTEIMEEIENKFQLISGNMGNLANTVVTDRVGKEITHLADIPSETVQTEFLPMLEQEYIDGGTDKIDDATDIYLPWSTVRSIVVMKRYVDAKIRALLGDEAGPECESCTIFYPDDERAGAAD